MAIFAGDIISASIEKANGDMLMGNVNIIVAAGRDGAIGRRGDLIWRIPADLRHFKTLTMGHPIIMGRKTWESLPKRPLPGRLNIVVTRSEGYEAPGAQVVASPEAALAVATAQDAEVFVIGGAQLYDAFMPLADRIYLTEVDDACEDADARLPFPLDGTVWKNEKESEWESTDAGVRFRYVTCRRI